MKFLALLVVVFVAAQASPLGGWTEQTAITDEVMDVARWTTSQLAGYTGIEGDHTVMTVRNLKTQIVNGINYSFTLDVLVSGADNKYYFRSCDVEVFDQKWTNTRTLTSASCRANPKFQFQESNLILAIC